MRPFSGLAPSKLNLMVAYVHIQYSTQFLGELRGHYGTEKSVVLRGLIQSPFVFFCFTIGKEGIYRGKGSNK